MIPHPYIKEAADRYGTCVRFVMQGKYRSRREVEARREVWTRLRQDGFSFPAIAYLTGCNHSSVFKALKRRAA